MVPKVFHVWLGSGDSVGTEQSLKGLCEESCKIREQENYYEPMLTGLFQDWICVIRLVNASPQMLRGNGLILKAAEGIHPRKVPS